MGTDEEVEIEGETSKEFRVHVTEESLGIYTIQGRTISFKRMKPGVLDSRVKYKVKEFFPKRRRRNEITYVVGSGGWSEKGKVQV